MIIILLYQINVHQHYYSKKLNVLEITDGAVAIELKIFDFATSSSHVLENSVGKSVYHEPFPVQNAIQERIKYA
jgi:hypothetical protein